MNSANRQIANFQKYKVAVTNTFDELMVIMYSICLLREGHDGWMCIVAILLQLFNIPGL